MTAEDLAALLRADPDRAVLAFQLARIAGPWRPHGERQTVRDCWSADSPFQLRGVRVAADSVAETTHDSSLLAEGWALAGTSRR